MGGDAERAKHLRRARGPGEDRRPDLAATHLVLWPWAAGGELRGWALEGREGSSPFNALWVPAGEGGAEVCCGSELRPPARQDSGPWRLLDAAVWKVLWLHHCPRKTCRRTDAYVHIWSSPPRLCWPSTALN